MDLLKLNAVSMLMELKRLLIEISGKKIPSSTLRILMLLPNSRRKNLDFLSFTLHGANSAKEWRKH
jgi:hypothetical protein